MSRPRWARAVARKLLRRPPVGPATPFGSVPSVAAGLGDWVVAQRDADALTLVSNDVTPYLHDAEYASTEDFARLAELLRAKLDRLGPTGRLDVPVEARVRAWLAAEARRDDLAAFIASRWHDNGNVRTRIDDGQVYAEYPTTLVGELPADVVQLGPAETALEATIRRCRRESNGLVLQVFAFVRAIDFGVFPPTFTATADGAPVSVRADPDPACTRASGRWFQSHDAGSILLRVPDPDSTVDLEVEAGGVTRRTTLTPADIAAAMPRPVGNGATGLSVADDHLDLHGTELRVPLTGGAWGFGPRPVPPGQLALGGDVPVSEELAGDLPLELLTPEHRIEVTAPEGLLRVRVAPPLADDELGPNNQQRLREEYAASTEVDDGLALFTTYAGQSVTDSPLAIFHELRARRPDLRLLWAVADHSVRAPEGAEPVLVRSRAWYVALATAHLVVTNIEMDRFFAPKPGQRLLQTFHGYPSKSMGLGLWQSKNFSPKRQEFQLAHTSATWSVLLTPAPEMDRHYREQYAYDGPILNQGYPRDDGLVGESAATGRAAARQRLGLEDGQIGVLYAPTWRDDTATNFRSAPMVTHLDVERLAQQLGDKYVVLLRGHRFHARAGARPGGARVLDVTTYPEINDLVLAADVAVLDYSSLRFDFAVTGKPMVFLVPDLEEYAGGTRGFLYPFTDSAPGPLLRTTDEVIAAVSDLSALAAAQADELSAFNATYNRFQDGHAAQRVVDRLLDGS